MIALRHNLAMLSRPIIRLKQAMCADAPLRSLCSSFSSIVVLAAATNRFEDLSPLVPNTLRALRTIRPGELVRVTA